MLVRSVTLSALAVALLAFFPASARAAAVARVVLKQSGATLVPGQTVVFEAAALDKRGAPVPGAQIRFKSSKPGIVSVQPDGTATAGNDFGEANVIALSGKKKATAEVDVVNPLSPPASPDLTLTQATITQVIAHDGWVYWTENGKKTVRLRKIAKTGGLIFDLRSEPAKDRRGLTVAYLQMRISGDRLFFSRQTRGYFQHWTILSLALAGGDPQTHLKQDISVSPLLPTSWNIVGRSLLVLVLDPSKLGLPNNTRLAVLNLDSGQWSAGIRDDFQLNRLSILTVDGQFAYLRGSVTNNRTQIARLDPAVGRSSLTELFTFDGEDDDTLQPGVTDGANLYFFSEGQRESHRLLSLPVGGGDPTSLLTGDLGFGLTLADGTLYFAIEGKRLVSLPVGGGNTVTLRSDLEPATTLSGIGIDNDSLYPVSKQGKVSTIHRIAR